MTNIATPRYPHGFFADPATGLPLKAGEPAVHWAACRNGTRDMILDRPVLYVDPQGGRWHVPAGFRCNGLSVPRFLWRLVHPYEPLTRDASVVHDWICTRPWISWARGARVFYQAMRANGVSSRSALIRYLAVLIVGGLFKWRHQRRWDG